MYIVGNCFDTKQNVLIGRWKKEMQLLNRELTNYPATKTMPYPLRYRMISPIVHHSTSSNLSTSTNQGDII